MHELGKQAIAAFNGGDTRKAKELCAEMVDNSTMLIRILDDLARSYA